jgi:Domain of unknown function (DUF4331)
MKPSPERGVRLGPDGESAGEHRRHTFDPPHTNAHEEVTALPFFAKRYRRAAIAMVTVAALGVGLLAGLGPNPGAASSHREAPLVSADPQVDGTDLYAFVSPDKPDTVTLISNWLPFEEPAGGPNFYAFSDRARYEINVDNDGDARPDLVYRWKFTNHYRNKNTFLYNTGPVTSLEDPDLNFYQTYDLTEIRTGRSKKLVDDAVVAPSNVGEASMPDYESLFQQAIYPAGCANCKTWTGQADDPFFLDLRVFDLLYGAQITGEPCLFKEACDDTLAGFNMNAFALQVPMSTLTKGGDGSGIVGIWTTALRPRVRVQRSDGSQSFTGSFVQLSRLGMPLVNEVVIPVGKKDRFNGSRPKNDGQFASHVLDPELPHVVNAVYGLPVPDCDDDPSNGIDRSCDLVPVFLTGLSGLNQPPGVQASEMLRLNTKIPPCEPGSCEEYSPLGVIAGDNAGFPNGRRLADDTIDVALRVVEGVLIPGHDPVVDILTDGVDANDLAFRSTFPYLALPHSGSNATPHPLLKV